MIGEYTPVTTLAVSDLDRARAFYEGVLGLAQADGAPPVGVLYSAGSGQVFVYPSEYAGTNKATAMTFELSSSQFDTEVAALRGHGVEFQTFEMDDIEWTDGVASMGGGDYRSVWFADPDGNILNLGARA